MHNAQFQLCQHLEVVYISRALDTRISNCGQLIFIFIFLLDARRVHLLASFLNKINLYRAKPNKEKKEKKKEEDKWKRARGPHRPIPS